MEAYNYSESPRDLNSPHDPSENGYSFARNNRPHCKCTRVARVRTTKLTRDTDSSQHSSHPSGASTVMNAGSASQSTTAVSTVSTEAPSSTTTANAFAYRNGRRMSSSSASRLEGKEVDGPVGFDEGIVNGLCDMDVSAMQCGLRSCADELVCSSSTRGQDKAIRRILQGEAGNNHALRRPVS